MIERLWRKLPNVLEILLEQEGLFSPRSLRRRLGTLSCGWVWIRIISKLKLRGFLLCSYLKNFAKRCLSSLSISCSTLKILSWRYSMRLEIQDRTWERLPWRLSTSVSTWSRREITLQSHNGMRWSMRKLMGLSRARIAIFSMVLFTSWPHSWVREERFWSLSTSWSVRTSSCIRIIKGISYAKHVWSWFLTWLNTLHQSFLKPTWNSQLPTL